MGCLLKASGSMCISRRITATRCAPIIWSPLDVDFDDISNNLMLGCLLKARGSTDISEMIMANRCTMVISSPHGVGFDQMSKYYSCKLLAQSKLLDMYFREDCSH